MAAAAAAATASSTSIQTAKSECRRAIKEAVRRLSAEAVESQSRRVTERVLALPEFGAARSVATFLSMPSGEVQTGGLVEACFAGRRDVFVPRVVGSRSMAMLRVPMIEALEVFSRSKWGIPEPPLPFAVSPAEADDASFDWTTMPDEAASAAAGSRRDADGEGAAKPLDLILVPGVGFDALGRRIGHGKGFYDTFFQRLRREHERHGIRFPILVGLCLDEQLVEEVPVDETDQRVDIVITLSRVIRVSDARA